MNDQLFSRTIIKYLNRTQELQSKLEISEIQTLVNLINLARTQKRNVFLAGNGGSATTASHFAVDLGTGTLKAGSEPVKALSLSENLGIITAISNDINFDSIYEKQIEVLGIPGDLLILFSASGNSRNLINAFYAATKLNLNIFSITGFDGGKLRELTKGFNIHVRSEIGEYGLVEDAHLSICHMITECIRAL